MVNTKALQETLSNIRATQESLQLDHTVEIVAVTKTHPFSAIQEVYNKGVVSIGENRVQEAAQKFRSFEKMPKMTKRFIGHLQTNKVKKCVELFDTIDSVDSLRLIKKISNHALKSNKTVPVLLEINTSGEMQKHGFLTNEIDEMLRGFDEESVCVDGLMTVGPMTSDKEKIRGAFKKLKELQTDLNNRLGYNQLKELSMGMSGDYQIAVEEGSTMVRVGRALFGARNE